MPDGALSWAMLGNVIGEGEGEGEGDGELVAICVGVGEGVGEVPALGWFEQAARNKTRTKIARTATASHFTPHAASDFRVRTLTIAQ